MNAKWERVGVLTTSLGLRRVSGRLKERPEDFTVCEILKGRIKDLLGQTGYPLFRMRKYNLDAISAKAKIERVVGGKIHLLGLKDKRALCYQFVSSTRKKAKASEVRGRRLSLIFIGRTERPLTRSDLMANGFSILVRTDEKDLELERWAESLERGKVANFFGIQRFGEENPNHKVGELLVRRDFGSAAKLILDRDFGSEAAAIDALREIPITLRRLYVQSYQAFLFNLMLSYIIKDMGELPADGARYFRKCPMLRRRCDEPIMIPEAQLVGFSFRNRGDVYSKYAEYLLDINRLTHKDFYIRGMEEISAEGAFRPVAIPAWHVNYRIKDEGILFKFVLHTGSYATVALRELFIF